MVCYHSINNDNNNNLKGAGIIRGPQQARRQQQTTITFPQTEINLVNNSLNIAGFYITRNPPTIPTTTRYVTESKSSNRNYINENK